jgi:hypothetical protein
MSYDTPPRDFTVGAPSRRPQVNVKALVAVPLVALVGFGVWSGVQRAAAKPATPAPAPVVKKPVATKPKPTIEQMGIGLQQAAIAEESYSTENNGAFTTRQADLVDQGARYAPGVTVAVVSADKDRYCLKATGVGTLALYYDSQRGRPSTTACR